MIIEDIEDDHNVYKAKQKVRIWKREVESKNLFC